MAVFLPIEVYCAVSSIMNTLLVVMILMLQFQSNSVMAIVPTRL